MARNQRILLSLLVLTLFTGSFAEKIMLSVNLKRPISTIDEKFLSLTIDPIILRSSNILSTDFEKSTNLAKSLAPAYIRIGGPRSNAYYSPAKYSRGDNGGEVTFPEPNWSQLRQWIDKTGLDLIACISSEYFNNNHQIDHKNTQNLSDIVFLADHLGYDANWQLGYECQTRCNVAGNEMGKRVASLRERLNKFPRYSNKIVIGPDVVNYRTEEELEYLRDYFKFALPALSAITWHPEFNGVGLEENGFSALEDELTTWSNLYRTLGRFIRKRPLWIAESKQEEGKDTFLGALALIKRLGDAAQLKFQVFMRQPSDLTHATPDYWVSLLHKRLIGRQVFDAWTKTREENNVRFYCQCTKPSSTYEEGSITVFGVNLTPENVTAGFRSLKPTTLHQFILSPGFDATNRIFAKTALLNNEILSLINDTIVPDLKPLILKNPEGLDLSLPPHGIGFWVLPDFRIRSCMENQGNPLVKTPLRKLQKRTINSSILEKDNPEESKDTPVSLRRKQRRKEKHARNSARRISRRFRRSDIKRELKKLRKLMMKKLANSEQKKLSSAKNSLGFPYRMKENPVAFRQAKNISEKSDSEKDARIVLKEFRQHILENKDGNNATDKKEDGSAKTETVPEALSLLLKLDNILEIAEKQDLDRVARAELSANAKKYLKSLSDLLIKTNLKSDISEFRDRKSSRRIARSKRDLYQKLERLTSTNIKEESPVRKQWKGDIEEHKFNQNLRRNLQPSGFHRRFSDNNENTFSGFDKSPSLVDSSTGDVFPGKESSRDYDGGRETEKSGKENGISNRMEATATYSPRVDDYRKYLPKEVLEKLKIPGLPAKENSEDFELWGAKRSLGSNFLGGQGFDRSGKMRSKMFDTTENRLENRRRKRKDDLNLILDREMINEDESNTKDCRCRVLRHFKDSPSSVRCRRHLQSRLIESEEMKMKNDEDDSTELTPNSSEELQNKPESLENYTSISSPEDSSGSPVNIDNFTVKSQMVDHSTSIPKTNSEFLETSTALEDGNLFREITETSDEETTESFVAASTDRYAETTQETSTFSDRKDNEETTATNISTDSERRDKISKAEVPVIFEPVAALMETMTEEPERKSNKIRMEDESLEEPIINNHLEDLEETSTKDVENLEKFTVNLYPNEETSTKLMQNLEKNTVHFHPNELEETSTKVMQNLEKNTVHFHPNELEETSTKGMKNLEKSTVHFHPNELKETSPKGMQDLEKSTVNVHLDKAEETSAKVEVEPSSDSLQTKKLTVRRTDSSEVEKALKERAKEERRHNKIISRAKAHYRCQKRKEGKRRNLSRTPSTSDKNRRQNRLEQIERLKEKLQRRRLLQKRRDEFPEGSKETNEDERRNLQRREAWEIINAEEKLGDLVDREKLAYILNYKPIDYDFTKAMENDDEVIEEKYVPTGEVVRSWNVRERRVVPRNAGVYHNTLIHHSNPHSLTERIRQRELQDNLAERYEQFGHRRGSGNSYYAIVENLHSPRIFRQKSEDERRSTLQGPFETPNTAKGYNININSENSKQTSRPSRTLYAVDPSTYRGGEPVLELLEYPPKLSQPETRPVLENLHPNPPKLVPNVVPQVNQIVENNRNIIKKRIDKDRQVNKTKIYKQRITGNSRLKDLEKTLEERRKERLLRSLIILFGRRNANRAFEALSIEKNDSKPRARSSINSPKKTPKKSTNILQISNSTKAPEQISRRVKTRAKKNSATTISPQVEGHARNNSIPLVKIGKVSETNTTTENPETLVAEETAQMRSEIKYNETEARNGRNKRETREPRQSLIRGRHRSNRYEDSDLISEEDGSHTVLVPVLVNSEEEEDSLEGSEEDESDDEDDDEVSEEDEESDEEDSEEEDSDDESDDESDEESDDESDEDSEVSSESDERVGSARNASGEDDEDDSDEEESNDNRDDLKAVLIVHKPGSLKVIPFKRRIRHRREVNDLSNSNMNENVSEAEELEPLQELNKISSNSISLETNSIDDVEKSISKKKPITEYSKKTTLTKDYIDRRKNLENPKEERGEKIAEETKNSKEIDEGLNGNLTNEKERNSMKIETNRAPNAFYSLLANIKNMLGFLDGFARILRG